MAPKTEQQKREDQQLKEAVEKQTKNVIDANLKTEWFKQAFLMSFLPQVTAPLAKKVKPSPYVRMVHTKKAPSLVNMVTMTPEVIDFLTAPTEYYAQLVPHIEIYKIFRRRGGGQEEALFPFTPYSDFDTNWGSQSSAQLHRGSDAGIRSVTYTLSGVGRNPAEAKLLDFNMDFFFNDIKTLSTPLGRIAGETFTFSDLFRMPAVRRSGGPKSEVVGDSRIKLVLGWNCSNNNPIVDDNFKNLVDIGKSSFILDYANHTMTFEENGAVSISVQFIGSLENTMNNPSADILYQISPDGKSNIQDYKAQLEYLKAQQKNSKRLDSHRNKKKIKLSAYKKALQDVERAEKNLKLAEKKFVASGCKDGTAEANTYTKLKQARTAAYEKQRAAASRLDSATQQRILQNENVYEDLMTQDQKKELKDAVKGGASKERTIQSFAVDREIENVFSDVSDLNKKIKKLEAKMANMKFNARAQDIFDYLFSMIDNKKVAWIPIDEFNFFDTYESYLELISGESILDVAKQLEKSVQTEPTKDIEEIKTQASEAIKSAQTTKTKEESTTEIQRVTTGTFREKMFGEKYKSGNKLFYFLLGDLISAIFDHNGFGDKMNAGAPNFRLLFGPLDYKPASHLDNVITNIYYIPISVPVFVDFLASKVLGTNRKTYRFFNFIADLISFLKNRVINNISNDASALTRPNGKINNFNLEISSLGLPNKSYKDPLIRLQDNNSLKNIGLGNAGANSISPTFMIHAKKSFDSTADIPRYYNGNVVEDSKQGVIHFVVGGPDAGVLISTQFSEVKIPGQAEAMWEKSQKETGNTQVGTIRPNFFQVSLTLEGSPYFFIGQLIYVNTRLIDGSGFLNDEKLGIGGYYRVTEVNNSITPGQWQTKISAVLEIADFQILSPRQGRRKSEIIERATPDQIAKYEKSLNKGVEQAAKGTPTVIAGDLTPMGANIA